MSHVAVLCAAPRSVYRQLEGVDVFDKRRDARSYRGAVPVVAHPPCRGWSVYLSHNARPAAGEKALGLWCADQLRRWGGVLEQPAGSRLFSAAGLPWPGFRDGDLFSVEVAQSWWGCPVRKLTWLCFAGIDLDAVRVPADRPEAHSGDRARWAKMSTAQRSATPPAFASWLVEIASAARPGRCAA